MKKLLAIVILFTSFSLHITAHATKTTTTDTLTSNEPMFQVGEDYELLASKSVQPQPTQAVAVLEFFSYGCPACYYLEPYLEQWLKKSLTHNTHNFEFSRIPVVFEPEWRLYAKAFYAAKALEISEKVTPALFKAIQEDNHPLQNKTDLEKFFGQQGIKTEDFDSVFNFSPRIDAQVNQSELLTQDYQITEIPTIIVAGTYKVTGRMARTRERLMAIVDFLIAKAQTERNSLTTAQ